MGDFVLGLTKTAVEGTVSLVKSTIEEEKKLRVRVQDDLVFISGELQMMQSFLTVASAERANNQVVCTWVRQLRDLAFDVEDCVEFVVHLDKPARWDWVRRLVSSVIVCMERPPLPLDVAVNEIKQLKARVEEVSQRNTRYNLFTTTDDSDSKRQLAVAALSARETEQQAYSRMLGEVWEASGKRHRMNDLRKLIDCQGSDLQVVSLWGSDDLGATSIIMKAYCHHEICPEFRTRAWVKLTQGFNPDEFLKSLLTQLYANISHQANQLQGSGGGVSMATDQDNIHLTKADLIQLLSHQRYLIVLEGVSTVAEWDVIRTYLPNANQGSRVVVTTRQVGLAILCTGNPYQVSELARFSGDQPLWAFFKKGSGHRDGLDELIWQLRRPGVISVCCPGNYTEFVTDLCDNIGNKSKVYDGVKFQHYLNFSPSGPHEAGDLTLAVDLAADLLVFAHPEDEQEELYEKIEAKKNEGNGSEIIESWRKFLAENVESYLVIIEGIESMKDWEFIRTNVLSDSPKLCVVVATMHERLAQNCVDYEYRALKSKDLCENSQQNQGYKGKKIDDANNWIDNLESWFASRDFEVSELSWYFNSGHVISVWGIAGVGKSSIVRTMYYKKIIYEQWEGYDIMYSWVNVPTPFVLKDFCRLLLIDFHSDDLQSKENTIVSMMEGQDPVQLCQKILCENKCRVVIDGLRSIDDWDLIKSALMSQYSRCNTVVITNEERVAKYCTNSIESCMLNVKGLDASAASRLFAKIIQTDQGDEISSDLVRKCGGLPRVITVVGEEIKKNGWKKDSINADYMGYLENYPSFHSLRGIFSWMQTYFDACSDSLKPCIYYLSVFSIDRDIRRRRLVRRWIAEGYAKDKFDNTAEEVGEKLFSELVNLSIIHVPPSRRKVASLCRVNGFFLEYILSRPMEDNLVFALEGRCSPNSGRTGKHLTVGESWDRDEVVFKSLDVSRLRSLTVSGAWVYFLVSGKMRLLRVLDLEDTLGVTDDVLEKIVQLLPRLKFLSIRGCQDISYLPDSLGDMKQLQTLDARGTKIVKLPEPIVKLEKLQYIRVGTKVASDDAARSTRRALVVAAATRTVAGAGEEVARGVAEATRAVAGAGEEAADGVAEATIAVAGAGEEAADGVAEATRAVAGAGEEAADGVAEATRAVAGAGEEVARRVAEATRAVAGAGKEAADGVAEAKKVAQPCRWRNFLLAPRRRFVRCSRDEQQRHNGGVESGARVGMLTALHTIGVLNVSGAGGSGKVILHELKKLTQLRKLGVSGITRDNWPEFCSVVSGHGHLESLSVGFDQPQEEEADEFACSFDDIHEPPRTLRILKVYGPGKAHARIRPVWIQNLPSLESADVELTVSRQEDIYQLQYCVGTHGPRASRLCVKPIEEQINFDCQGFIEPDSLRIVCSSPVQDHCEVTFGTLLDVRLEVLEVHFCSNSGSSSEDGGHSGSSPLRISRLSNIRRLKQVWLTGYYSEEVKEDILKQLALHHNKPVLRVEQPLST